MRSVPKSTPDNAEPVENQPLDRYSIDGRDGGHLPPVISLRTFRDTKRESIHDDAGRSYDRRYDPSRRPMGSTHREEERRQLIKHNRSAGAAETPTCPREPINTSVFEVPAASHDRETRLLEGGKGAARESSGELGKPLEDGRAEEQGLQTADKTTPPTCAWAHALGQMNDQASKLDPGVESPIRTGAAAEQRLQQALTNHHDVLKGPQQAEFLLVQHGDEFSGHFTSRISSECSGTNF